MAGTKLYAHVDLRGNQAKGLVLELWDPGSLPTSAVEGRFGYHQILKVPVYWDGLEFKRVATQAYVNETVEGLAWKDDVRVATTGNIDIATALNDGDTIDNVTLADSNRVLVKDQTDASENGVYIVGATPARSTDLDDGSEFNNAIVAVNEGDSNAGTVWRCDTIDPVVDTDDVDWVEFSPTVPYATTIVSGRVFFATLADHADENVSDKSVTPQGLHQELDKIYAILNESALTISDGASGVIVIGDTADHKRVKVVMTISRDGSVISREFLLVYDGSTLHFQEQNIFPYVASAPELNISWSGNINGTDIELQYVSTAGTGDADVEYKLDRM